MVNQLYRSISVLLALLSSNKHFLYVNFRKAATLTLAALTVLTTQSAMSWDTSPSSGSTYTWNLWGSNLEILFDGAYVEAIPEAERLQVNLVEVPEGYCSTGTSAETPCLRLHGKIPACIDSNSDGCDIGIDTVVLAYLDVTIDPVNISNDIYTASGKKTNIDGQIVCEDILYPETGVVCGDLSFPAAIGLPKGGNLNKIFPPFSIFLQGEEVNIEAGQLLYLGGPLDAPKGPVLRHCFEQGKEPGTGVVDCGTPSQLRTAAGELIPFIGNLAFESTTTNLNIGKNAESFSIHVNLLSQTNDDGLAFIPEQIDFTKSLAIEGQCEPVLGQITWSDINDDGITDARLRYDGGCIAGLTEVTSTPDGGSVVLNIRGTLLDGVQFEGSFSVTVNQ